MSQETIASGRSRRARKAINYSLEQQFSDDDGIFDEDVRPEPAARKKANRVRKYTGSAGIASYQAPAVDGGVSFERTKPVYTERGYDPYELPIRERFTFEPEYEEDGSPKIEMIIGRRPIEDTKDRTQGHADANDEDRSGTDDDSDGPALTRTRSINESDDVKNTEMDYEYLIKYKGRSYLHLEWKTAADLESMNTAAKTAYRRFLKKLEKGTEDDLEDPTIDPSFTEPGRILAEEEHEVMVELTDKELAKWEKERKKEMEEESSDEEDDDKANAEEEKKDEDDQAQMPEKKEEVEFIIELREPGTMTYEELKQLVSREEPYYSKYPGSENAYRDGYITEPPRKPRPSYLFFQSLYRSYFQRIYPNASHSKVMSLLGESWNALSEEQQLPFVMLGNDEAAQFEKEKVLLEKAQKPTEVWQPIRRCYAVLDRLCSEQLAEIFLEPVDTDVFDDYLDIVDSPMDLRTVRERLATVKNWQGPEVFARDVRKVFNNCKIYNAHGTAIWHVADYMSKLFERLYHAWVLDFRDRYLRWANPAARPWETSCRGCDGKCKEDEARVLLCDHCDASYNVKCLVPKLKKIPKGVWHCPSCAPKIGKNRSVTILSAEAELVVRRRAEMGDIPKKPLKQKMFLVKWAGLGYEHCTWETQEDINDDAVIAEFYRLEGVTPEEPDLTEKEIQAVIDSAVTVTHESAGGKGITEDIVEMRTQLYAQTRSFQFKKFGMDTPHLLAAECGPNEKIFASFDSNQPASEEVKLCLDEIVWKVANNNFDLSTNFHIAALPPPLEGEYDVRIPVTSHGLLLNVGEVKGNVAFLGYRKMPDGSAGPSEIRRLVHNHGDIIIAVNGKSVVGKSFAQVIPHLKDVIAFAHLRFVAGSALAKNGLTSSCGALGKFLYDDIVKECKKDRRRMLAKRSMALLAEEADDESTSSEEVGDSSDDNSDDSSASDVEFDRDDEDLVIEGANSDESAGASDREDGNETSGESKAESPKSDKVVDLLNKSVLKQESTRHLAYSLLDIDIGYSSDEGGDENVAYYIDGVDSAFTRENEVPSKPSMQAAEVEQKENVVAHKKFPVKKTDFSIIGSKAQLQIAMALTGDEPDAADFDNFPRPSAKEIAALKKKAEEEARKEEEEARALEEKRIKEAEAAAKPKVKSTTKVEQVSTSTNEVVRVWVNADDAASTMQLSLNDIQTLLSGVYDADIGDEVGGYRWRYADEDAVVTEKVTGRDSKKGREAYLEFRDKLYDSSEPHVYKGGNRLRDYQIDGVNWLSSCYYKEQGCILADEMGLGKTVQIVSYLEHLHRVEKVHGPFLVVVPLSTVEHWRREFEGWTDMQCCVYHDRQRVWRDVLREYEWYYEDRPHTPDYLKFNVLVTTYDTLIGDFDIIGEVPWRVAIVDEAHRLRNIKGKLLECMKEISAKGTLKYGYQSRVLMTGTPLQNNTQELWTLLNFIEPSLFRDLDDFEDHFGNMANREQVEALQRKISPFMLRRVKEDVAKDIPAKEETVIDVELTSIQKQYYRAIFEHNHAFLSMGLAKGAAPKMMNIQMELRKCCNHPFLLDGVESRELENRHEQLRANGEFENKSPDEQHALLNEYGYVLSSGKMVLLDKLLPKLRQEGHKVLIFSQFVKMLDLIGDYCEFRGFNYERLDGRVRGNERQKAIDRFETEKDSFVFLLSTRAGGVGINLTAADICIIFDSDWNPQNDVQAQARCHRIGQTKDVRIYRLVTSRSFEQEMFDRASKKLGLEQAVLGTFGQDNDDDKPTSKEMEQLLKRGAYALLEDENDEIGKEFVADNIENILENRTRTRVVEGAKTASWLNKKGMNVTKSKFAADKESADLDIDDPLFWQKVMPDFVTPDILLNRISEIEAEMEKLAPGRKSKNGKTTRGLSRGNQKKIREFMNDLKGVMDDIFEQDSMETLLATDKATCQKLLLTISVKQNMFNDEQRKNAQRLLSRLEGDRRRKCRTSNIGTDAPTGVANVPVESIRKELLIVSSKKKRRRVGKKKGSVSDFGADDSEEDEEEEESAEKKKKKIVRGLVDEDGFLLHSDDEDQWSDVDDGGNKRTVSLLELKNRREWGAGKSELKLAGMPWPVFPRNFVTKVLGTLIDESIKIDQKGLGIFSVPVPRDEYPDYYELIKKPMDYGTMKEKLENGEYRSAQAMQKDFVLVMENCRQFNAPDSDIVKEAMRQTLMRPKLLKEAALKNNLFISEDGSIIEVVAEKKRGKKVDSTLEKSKGKLVACGECIGCKKKACKKCKNCTATPKKRCVQRKCTDVRRVDGDDEAETKTKPRIHIKLPSDGSTKKKAGDKFSEEEPAKKKSRRSKGGARDSLDEEETEEMFDVEKLQAEEAELDGTFRDARNHYTKRGSWYLPPKLDSKFKQLAHIVLSNMSKADNYEIFADPVDAIQMPEYYDVISNPMDFSTMRSNVDKGVYGKGSEAASKLYEDFLLVFDNCHEFNGDTGDVIDEAIGLLGMLPTTFALAVEEVSRQL